MSVQNQDHIILPEFISYCISSCSLPTFYLFYFQLNMCPANFSIVKHAFSTEGWSWLTCLPRSHPPHSVHPLRVNRIHSKFLSVIHQHFISCVLFPGLFCATTISFADFSNPACAAHYVSKTPHPTGVRATVIQFQDAKL